MVVNDRPTKRIKRNRVTADLHDFQTFPVEVDAAASSPRPFRESVRMFLERYARPTGPHPSLFPSLVTWQVVLRAGGAGGEPVALDVVEEDVTRSARSVYCNQCRVVGWSGHPVCRKRYHFIIRTDFSGADDGYTKSCEKCGNSLHLSDSRCKWCETLITANDVEEWVYSQLEDNTQCHLLHGVIHSNGFGHLLRLNGKEGGSRSLSGHDIMCFWDRLCTSLSVRKVTVMDVSKKCGTEYRLLHAITKGRSWYGDWGYEFKHGSYALKLDAYKKSIDTLSSVPLVAFLYKRSRKQMPLQAMISFYRSLSDTELVTLKDLFKYLMKLIHGNCNLKFAKESFDVCKALCAWTRNDVESVQDSLVRILLAAGKGTWVRRHSLKGVLCKTVTLELLDYCLLHLPGKCTSSGMVVQSRHNRDSHDAEFRLAPPNSTHSECLLTSEKHLSKEQLRHDLRYLFDSLVNPSTMVKHIPRATREVIIDAATKLLDCKQFVKDYCSDKEIYHTPVEVHLTCHVEISEQGRDHRPVIPPEVIVLPANATILDLKNEATKAFQDVYAMFSRFEAEKLLEYGPLNDSMTLKFLVGQSGVVKIKGSCPTKHAQNEFRMERGTEKWIVDCKCGTRDDDGERMLACDKCGVWKHTRCEGIADADEIPNKFVCLACINQCNPKVDEASCHEETKDSELEAKPASFCRLEARGNRVYTQLASSVK